MKKLANLAALSLVLVGISNATARAETVEEEIVRLEKEGTAAVISRNYDKIQLLAAPDWYQQDNSDEKITLELMISRLRSGEYDPERTVFGPMSVDVFGDVAVVMGSEDERFTFDGRKRAVHSNFLEVWTKRNGQWMAVRAQQGSRAIVE